MEALSSPGALPSAFAEHDVARRVLLATLFCAAVAPARALSRSATTPPAVLAGVLNGINEPGGSMEHAVLRRLESTGTGSPLWLPWARALQTAERGNALLFPLARTRDRESRWQWLAPLASDVIVLVVSAATARSGVRLENLRPLRIGVIRSAFILARLQDMGFEAIDIAPAELSNAKKLALGRIDAWATIGSIARAVQHRDGLPPGARVVALDPQPFSMWLAASRDVDVATAAAVSGARAG